MFFCKKKLKCSLYFELHNSEVFFKSIINFQIMEYINLFPDLILASELYNLEVLFYI